MRNINYLNYFFVGVPAVSFIICFLNNQNTFLVFGLLFSILTGLFQITIGGSMLSDEPTDRNLQLYMVGVVFYFTLLFFIDMLLSNNLFKKCLVFGIPTVLALFLSIIIYKKAHK